LISLQEQSKTPTWVQKNEEEEEEENHQQTIFNE
jgi:hypothetical protein